MRARLTLLAIALLALPGSSLAGALISAHADGPPATSPAAPGHASMTLPSDLRGIAALAAGLPPGVANAEVLRAGLTHLGAGLAAARAGDLLLRVSALDPAAGIEDLPAPRDLAAALARLYAAAGLDPPTAFTLPPPGLAEALAPAVEALAFAMEQTRAAFASLDAEDAAWLAAHLLDAAPDARTQRLATRVDVGAIERGAAVLANALHAFPVRASLPPEAQGPWTDPLGLVEVAGIGPDVHTARRALLIEPGGDDTYLGAAAAYDPGMGPWPVRAVLDQGGDDRYEAQPVEGADTMLGQGVGIQGIGLLLDLAGNDVYEAAWPPSSLPCRTIARGGSTAAAQERGAVFTQGVGILGVGLLFDAQGDDSYIAVAGSSAPSDCPLGRAEIVAQGAGLLLGAGVLADLGGNDRYVAYANEDGSPVNVAHVAAQGVAAGASGLLLDAAGDDAYYASASVQSPSLTTPPPEGGSAFVHAQGAVFVTPNQVIRDLGALRDPCAPAPAGDGPPCVGGFSDTNLCQLITAGDPTVQRSGACDREAVALVLDLGGVDRYSAGATAQQGDACAWNSWAVVLSQGSAAWDGFAALANLGSSPQDVYQQQAYAVGQGCGTWGVHAHARGQGYAGPIPWDPWDYPDAEDEILLASGLLDYGNPAPFWLPAVGVLISGPSAGQAAGCGGRECQPAGSDYTFTRAVARNFGANDGTSVADSWAQGAAGDLAAPAEWGNAGRPAPRLALPGNLAADASAQSRAAHGVGVGLHIDQGGNDVLYALADATHTGTVGQAHAAAYGQGASEGGIAGLVNLQGNDAYVLWASENDAEVPAQEHGQAWASGVVESGRAAPIFCLVMLCSDQAFVQSTPAAALYVDLGGYDYANLETQRAGCWNNGYEFGAWPSQAPLLGPVWWGTALAFPCTAPTPASGDGLSVGLDWLSDGVATGLPIKPPVGIPILPGLPGLPVKPPVGTPEPGSLIGLPILPAPPLPVRLPLGVPLSSGGSTWPYIPGI